MSQNLSSTVLDVSESISKLSSVLHNGGEGRSGFSFVSK